MITTLPLVDSQSNLLSSCFNNTAAAYKFYWFISLIEEVEKGNYLLKKQDIFAGLIADSWYTVNYFNIRLPGSPFGNTVTNLFIHLYI